MTNDPQESHSDLSRTLSAQDSAVARGSGGLASLPLKKNTCRNHPESAFETSVENVRKGTGSYFFFSLAYSMVVVAVVGVLVYPESIIDWDTDPWFLGNMCNVTPSFSWLPLLRLATHQDRRRIVNISCSTNCHPQVTGGNFWKNEAESGGGFVHKEGGGNIHCSGVTIEDHSATDGGAIYVWNDAVLEWECDLVGSAAISGAAM